MRYAGNARRPRWVSWFKSGLRYTIAVIIGWAISKLIKKYFSATPTDTQLSEGETQPTIKEEGPGWTDTLWPYFIQIGFFCLKIGLKGLHCGFCMFYADQIRHGFANKPLKEINKEDNRVQRIAFRNRLPQMTAEQLKEHIDKAFPRVVRLWAFFLWAFILPLLIGIAERRISEMLFYPLPYKLMFATVSGLIFRDYVKEIYTTNIDGVDLFGVRFDRTLPLHGLFFTFFAIVQMEISRLLSILIAKYI